MSERNHRAVSGSCLQGLGIRWFTLLALLLTAVSCATPKPAVLTPAERQLLGNQVVIDLFSARGFLGGSQYERYHLTDSVLWRECGDVSTAKHQQKSREVFLEGDQVFVDDPNLLLRERRVDTLSSSQLKKVHKIAATMLKRIKQTETRPPLPGSVFSLAAPGLFELNVKTGSAKERLVTSVDAVSDAKEEETERVLVDAHDLFSVLRGVGPVICGSKTFFGVGRNAS